MLFVFISVAANSYSQKTPPLILGKDRILVGKEYQVNFHEKIKSFDQKDKISFNGRQINSPFITREEGFPELAYTTAIDSVTGNFTFSSEGKDPKGRTIRWHGSVSGLSIEGTALITNKKGKIVRQYSFTGTLLSKQ